MEIVVEQMLIREERSVVYDAYRNILEWGNVLDNVESIELLEDKDGKQDFYYTIRKENGTETVRTIRKLHPPFKIEMKQIITPPAIKIMRGVWSFTESGPFTMVTAQRFVEFKENENVQEKLNNLRMMLNKNLSSFKDSIEKKSFTVSEVMNVPVDTVMKHFWDIDRWKEIWDPVSKIEVVSEKENTQVFTMEVEMNNVPENIVTRRTMWDNKITLMSVKPIKAFKKHWGEWRFKSVDENCTIVYATRNFIFSDSYPSEKIEEFAKQFEERVHNILMVFSVYYQR